MIYLYCWDERRDMLRKIKSLLDIIKYFFKDEETLFLYLLEKKAVGCLKDCEKLEICNTEEIEDLIFHIRTYHDIPRMLKETEYSDLKNETLPKIMKKYRDNEAEIEDVERYADFLTDLETQRALERDYIFECAKVLPFGFKL